MLQSCYHLCGPLLDSVQYVHLPLGLMPLRCWLRGSWGMPALSACQCLKPIHTGCWMQTEFPVEVSKAYKASFSNACCPPLHPFWQQLGCQFAVAIGYPTFHLLLLLFTFFTLCSCYQSASVLRGSSSERHLFLQLLHPCNHSLLHWQQLEYPGTLWLITSSTNGCS